MTSFLQHHYNLYRRTGGEHAEFVTVNKLSDKQAAQLKAEYERDFPDPVSEKRTAERRQGVEREMREAQRRDETFSLFSRGPGRS